MFKSLKTLPVLALAAACGGGGEMGVQMKLTDAPTDIEGAKSITVTIDEVKIHVVADAEPDAKEPAETDTTATDAAAGKSGWKSVCKEKKDFDLLTLTGGKTTDMCAEAKVDSGKVTQIRLVVSKGVIAWTDTAKAASDLEISSGTIKIVGLAKAAKDGEKAEFVLDFDAAASVTKAGDKYKLKPTIKIK